MGLDQRLLVTGSGGQLGRAFGRLFPDAVLLDRQALDVTDRDAVLKTVSKFRPELIIHTAAFTKVDGAEADPDSAQAVNVRGTEAIAAAAERTGAFLVYPSTDYVFSGEKHGAYREDDPTGPLSVYGSTKLQGEKVAAGVDRHLIVRTSWLFGEGHNFVRTVTQAARTQRELPIVDDQWGRPTYALDLASGILQLLDKRAKGLFHLAGAGSAATWADLAEEALRLVGSRVRVIRVATAEYLAQREGKVAPRPANSVLDCSKAAALGVTLRPWQEGLAAYMGEWDS